MSSSKLTKKHSPHVGKDKKHPDIFVVPDKKDNKIYDFVTIDDTFADLSDAVMIDMSTEEDYDYDSFSIDINVNTDSFVTLDDDVIVSGFTDDDFNATIIDLDLTDIDDNNL